jgi:ribosomal protein S18 acetylase RimI-like enzyme
MDYVLFYVIKMMNDISSAKNHERVSYISPSCSLSLRPAEKKDYDFLWHLHCQTMGGYLEETLGVDLEKQEIGFKKEFFEYTQIPYSIININGESCGMVWIDIKPEEIYLAILEILPKFQNRKIGESIIREFVLAPAIREKKTVSLFTLKVNKRAQQFYERLGFKLRFEEQNRLKYVFEFYQTT